MGSFRGISWELKKEFLLDGWCCLDWAEKPLDRTSAQFSHTHVPDITRQNPVDDVNDNDDDLLPVIVTFATVAKEKSSN